MKKLVIIDGSGFLFRAWYAFPPMLDTEGKNQNVIYGFMRMMLKLLLEQPDYFIITRDSPVKTKRHENYEDYKANRKKIDEEFKQQIPLVQKLVQQLGIPNIIAPGYEADDTIATLVGKYEKETDLTIQVFSSDKDLKQFLSQNVVITDPIKNQTTQVGDFEKEFGFAPISIIDYLALIGDSADNIKGVAGIGPKKASDLIKRYGTIENIYDHIEEIPDDIQDKLLAGKEEAFFCKGLITLMKVPTLANHSLTEARLEIDFTLRENLLLRERKLIGLGKPFEALKKKYTQPQQLGLF